VGTFASCTAYRANLVSFLRKYGSSATRSPQVVRDSYFSNSVVSRTLRKMPLLSLRTLEEL